MVSFPPVSPPRPYTPPSQQRLLEHFNPLLSLSSNFNNLNNFVTKVGRWCDGRCQEDGGEKLEECCKEASEEGLGSKGSVVPMMMMMMMNNFVTLASTRLILPEDDADASKHVGVLTIYKKYYLIYVVYVLVWTIKSLISKLKWTIHWPALCFNFRILHSKDSVLADPGGRVV